MLYCVAQFRAEGRELTQKRDRLIQIPLHPCGTRQICIRHHHTQTLCCSSKLYRHPRALADRVSSCFPSCRIIPHDLVFTALIPGSASRVPTWLWGIKFQTHPRNRLKEQLDERLPSFEAAAQPYQRLQAGPDPPPLGRGRLLRVSFLEIYGRQVTSTRAPRYRCPRLLLPDAPTDLRALTGTSHHLVRPYPAQRIAELPPLRVYRGRWRLPEACGDHTTVCRVAGRFLGRARDQQSPVLFPIRCDTRTFAGVGRARARQKHLGIPS